MIFCRWYNLVCGNSKYSTHIHTKKLRIPQISGNKVNTWKTVFLYTNNKESEREIIKAIPCTTASKRIKDLGINSLKEVEDLHSENYKTLLEEIRT